MALLEPRPNRVSRRGLEPPWSVLGVSVEHACDVADAVRIAELDWDVEAIEPIMVSHGNQILVVPGHAATVRLSPNLRALAVVTDQYRVVQNRDAFAMVDDLLRESDLRFGWAGEYDEGRKVFLTLSDPEPIVVGSDDVHYVHYMALNSHDRSTALRLEIVLSRRRDNSQPVMSFPDVDRQVRLKHTRNVDARSEEARETLPGFRSYLAEFLAQAEAFERQPYSSEDFRKYARKVFRKRSNVDDIVGEAHGLFLEESRTKWGAYCAIVRWLDAFQTVKGRVGTQHEQRAIRMLGGVSTRLKESAADELRRT